MIIRAREVIPGVIWVYDVPIRRGETGSWCNRCGTWHWATSIVFLPPGHQPFGRLDWAAPVTSSFDEHSRVNMPAERGEHS